MAIGALRARAEELGFLELLRVPIERWSHNPHYNWATLLHCYPMLKEHYGGLRNEKEAFELCVRLRSKISSTGMAYTIGDLATLVGKEEAEVREVLEMFGKSLGLSVEGGKGG